MCLYIYIYICSVRRLGTSANLLLRRFITHCSCSFFSVRRPGSWRGPGARFFSSSAWQDGGAWGTQLPVDNSERCELVLFGNWCCVCMSYIYFECRGDLWKFKDTITWDEQGRMRLYSSGSACWCSDWHTHLFPSASWSEPKWWMGTSLGVQHFWKNEGTFQTTIKEFPGRGRWMSAGVPGIEPTARLYRTALGGLYHSSSGRFWVGSLVNGKLQRCDPTMRLLKQGVAEWRSKFIRVALVTSRRTTTFW